VTDVPAAEPAAVATDPATEKTATEKTATEKTAPATSEMTEAKQRRRRALTSAVRIVVLLVGLGVVVWLVWRAGPEKVLTAIKDAGLWLPVLAVMETMMNTCDLMSARSQLGVHKSRVPVRTWIQASTLAFALMILFPAGRAAGEIARATAIGRHVGLARAAVASAGFNAANLFAVAILSAVGGVFAWFGPPETHALAIALAINVALVGGIGVFVTTMLHSKKAAAFIVGRLKLGDALKAEVSSAVSESLNLPKGIAWCVLGRTVQWAQFAVFVVAIGGKAGIVSASLAQGIHLIGATAGDMIPNQAATLEGAYVGFADAIHLTADRALALPLLHRVELIALALLCLLISTVIRRADAKV
jgi:hypothetical protein